MPSPSFISTLTSIAQIKSARSSAECASLIIPRLYLSDFSTVMNEDTLSNLGVTHVVSVLDWAPEFLASIPTPHRLHISLSDLPTSNILPHLDTTTQFIKEALEQNETNIVLVHCFQGVSRSATVVCAYLIATAGMTAMESITFVQSKRKIVSPNNGFRKQLSLYAAGGAQGSAVFNVTMEERSSRSADDIDQAAERVVQETKVIIGTSSESPL
ncbi:protein-tyrosine phosphatase-like protein [Lentinula raphanica]|nr:protein-tyrosine phosphatase-like protein [Lentinula raphanica]